MRGFSQARAASSTWVFGVVSGGAYADVTTFEVAIRLAGFETANRNDGKKHVG
jgi:hypothetical protein